MKTLDEVIEELEDEGLFADALHYLQEYRDYQQGIIRLGDEMEKALDRAFPDNPALTWDELKQMADKPIWLEEREFCDDPFVGNWRLIDCIEIFENDKDTERMRVTGSELESYGVYRRDMGEYWQAFRKERS